MSGSRPVMTLAPSAEPISLAQAKRQLRVDGTDEDTLISSLISAARNYVEQYCAVQIVGATYQQKWDYFPPCGEMYLSRPPLQYVSSITYVDTSGVTQTLDTSVYEVVATEKPAEIRLAYGQYWPATRCQEDAVTVTYRAGYLRPFTADATTDALTFASSQPADLEDIFLSTTDNDLPAPLAINTAYDTNGLPGLSCSIRAAGSGSNINITDAGTGTHFIGVLPEAATQAMLLLITFWWSTRNASVDIEGSTPQVQYLLSTLNWGAI